ncbi:hypothetical protein GCM10009100_17390 [Thalassospira tepidiphila]
MNIPGLTSGGSDGAFSSSYSNSTFNSTHKYDIFNVSCAELLIMHAFQGVVTAPIAPLPEASV